MNKKRIREAIRKELAEVAAKPECEVDFSDIQATREADWQGAVRGKFYRPSKGPKRRHNPNQVR